MMVLTLILKTLLVSNIVILSYHLLPLTLLVLFTLMPVGDLLLPHLRPWYKFWKQHLGKMSSYHLSEAPWQTYQEKSQSLLQTLMAIKSSLGIANRHVLACSNMQPAKTIKNHFILAKINDQEIISLTQISRHHLHITNSDLLQLFCHNFVASKLYNRPCNLSVGFPCKL